MAVILVSAPALPSTVIVTMTPRVLLIVLAAPTGSVAVALAVPVAVPVPLGVPARLVALPVSVSVAISAVSSFAVVVAVPALAVPVVVARGVVTLAEALCER